MEDLDKGGSEVLVGDTRVGQLRLSDSREEEEALSLLDHTEVLLVV